MKGRAATHAFVRAAVLVASLVSCSSAAPQQSAARPSAPTRGAVDAGTAARAAPRAQDAGVAHPTPDEKEAKLIARMLRRVSTARQLEATKPVPGVVLAREALIARVKSHVDREVPREAIRQEGLVQQLLGFIPTKFNYEAETYALLESQLAGFYEPSDGTMYMAADLDDDNAQATLAHELVHALQDQRFDLASRSKYAPGFGDRSSAFSALAEGDATSAMADVLIARAQPGATALDLPEELFAEQVIGSMSTGPTANAPHVMRTSLVAPYVDGTLFVHALRRKGGWDAVNRAWTNPPVTTEQILHVAKWEAHEAAIAVSDPTIRALGAGWSVVDADTYGELGVRLSFEEWFGAKDAGADASGWGGDRGTLAQKGDEFALAWRIRFDAAPKGGADAFAVRAWAALAPAIEAKLGRSALADATPFLCVERAELGPLAIARRGRDLIVIAGPASTVAKGWSATGHCPLAKAWALEVASAP